LEFDELKGNRQAWMQHALDILLSDSTAARAGSVAAAVTIIRFNGYICRGSTEGEY